MAINLIEVPVMITQGESGSEFVTITGETTSSPHFAITPAIRRDDRGTYLGWGMNVTHIPTGLTLPTGGADKRKTVDAVKDLIDWSSTTPLVHPADKKLVVDAVRALMKAEDDPWPAWAGDQSTPALSLLVGQLDDGIENYKTRRDARDELVGEVAEFDAALAKKVGGALDAGLIGIQVQTFGTSWLLAVLMQLDPAIADQAARGLVSAWEDGGAPDELIYEWRDDIANNRQPTLQGITFPSQSLDLDETEQDKS
ncbi:hypothetical protein [Rhodococcus qingshengii]|uniref:hypothetical protein n=1 Tax=Rhodococcus qingshengii TaxID=334542 RepID=UPI001ADF66F0|nr:hypothetical protein [Rhodococcus qingshengii]MCQ4150282.1 hypothetical protein [Rhodococcus qingshengii]